MEHANSGKSPTATAAHTNRGRLQDDLEQLRQAAADRGGELISNLRGWIEERPVPAVAAAFAVGFVISGGLFSRMTWRFARLGARTYLRSFLGEMLSQGAREMFAGLVDTESASDPAAHVS